MKIATWNVNSVRVRLSQVLEFIEKYDIDIILLQEIKCKTEEFPKYIFDDIGYNCRIFGQKSYNGVAILSKYMIEDVIFGAEIFLEDSQARYVEALINGYNFASVYVPNGKSPDDPAYQYKLDFLDILINRLKQTSSLSQYILAGDFNITMADTDVYDPDLWKNKICCTELERTKLRDIVNLGYRDIMKELRPFEEIYTWWDYRRETFSKNKGLRLDYFFVDHRIQINNCHVAKEIRNQLRPSDHAPVILEI
ncbi:MAG: exodeoxyribonuclease III [Holosporales bacterium]|jgi:exodeoxyribonuclease-3|nr:exodeoxyribonuclease III [Holosporales bacterium]